MAPALGLKFSFQILLDTSGLSKYGLQVGDIRVHYLLNPLWISPLLLAQDAIVKTQAAFISVIERKRKQKQKVQLEELTSQSGREKVNITQGAPQFNYWP